MMLAVSTDELPWTDRVPEAADVLIVGGGFSGLMTLVHVAEHAPAARVALIERRPAHAPGVAYGACDPVHLLNVPAGRMGATSQDVGEFFSWLEARHPGQFQAGSFAPRSLYGKYLLELVRARLAQAWPRIALVRQSAVHIDHAPNGSVVRCADGALCRASSVVLALGLPPAPTPWGAAVDESAPATDLSNALVADPWAAGVFDGVPSQAPVVIVGSGLTAIDVVLALRTRGHQGRITMISRNGRFPLPHGEAGDSPHQFERVQLQGGPSAVLGTIRRVARERSRRGQGWQPVVDALRAHTAATWHGWSAQERQRFLRHARPFWEVHRHRVPRAVLQQIDQLRASGSLELVQGVLAGVELQERAQGVRVLHQSASGPTRATVAQRVYNCIGPATSMQRTRDPLLRSLIDAGAAAVDAAGLGLMTDEMGHLLDIAGRADSRVYVVGALRRADAWESTAVPELRVQSEHVARAVVHVLGSSPSPKGAV
jgi:uncharacterized NAD(P)/FAD-binding protein YdhS